MKRLRLKKGLVCFGTQTSMNPKRGKAVFIVPAPAVVALRIQPIKKPSHPNENQPYQKNHQKNFTPLSHNSNFFTSNMAKEQNENNSKQSHII